MACSKDAREMVPLVPSEKQAPQKNLASILNRNSYTQELFILIKKNIASDIQKLIVFTAKYSIERTIPLLLTCILEQIQNLHCLSC
jgi:hypothetical protein